MRKNNSKQIIMRDTVMTKYPPLFKRIPLSDNSSGNYVAEIQNEFEVFWRRVSALVPKNPEKTQGMRKLQEACMWLTKANCVACFHEENPSEGPEWRSEHR